MKRNKRKWGVETLPPKEKNMKNKDKELKRILQTRMYGWIKDSDIAEEDKPIVYQGIKDKKVGIFIYHSHEYREPGKLVFKGFKIGYYYRSKNPFKWKHKQVAFFQ
jgi:hypothetical protein